MRRVLCWLPLLLCRLLCAVPASIICCLVCFRIFYLPIFLFLHRLFTPICYFLHHTYDVYFYLITFRFTTNHLPLHHCIALHRIALHRVVSAALHIYYTPTTTIINNQSINHSSSLPAASRPYLGEVSSFKTNRTQRQIDIHQLFSCEKLQE